MENINQTNATQQLMQLMQASQSESAAPAPATEKTENDIDLTAALGGIQPEQVVQKYIDLFMDGQAPTEGTRNSQTFELAVHLRTVYGFSLEALKRVIPRYDNFPQDEWERTLQSALAEPQKGVTRNMKAVLDALRKEQVQKQFYESAQNIDPYTCPYLPPLPQKLPPLLQLVTKYAPKHSRAVIADAANAALANYLGDVTFEHNGDLLPIVLQYLIIASKHSGKRAVMRMADAINKRIQLSDNDAREELVAWNRACSGKRASKDAPPRPNVLIQLCESNTTNAALVDRLADADRAGGKPISFLAEEVEDLRGLNDAKLGRNWHETLLLLIRKFFDAAMHGQERVGKDSICRKAPAKVNLVATTVPGTAVAFLPKSAMNTGAVDRLSMLTMPLPKDKPQARHYDEDFQDKLLPYIDRLREATGTIKCKKLDALIDRLLDECKAYAEENDADEYYNGFGIRAAIIAKRKGYIQFIAHGRWSKEIEDYVTWSFRNDLATKMHFFGKSMREAMDEEQRCHFSFKREQPTLLSLLPKEFTIEQYTQMKQKQGLATNTNTLRTWCHRGKVFFDEERHLYVQTS